MIFLSKTKKRISSVTNDGDTCIVVEDINQIECDESSQVIWKAVSSWTFQLFRMQNLFGEEEVGVEYLLISAKRKIWILM